MEHHDLLDEDDAAHAYGPSLPEKCTVGLSPSVAKARTRLGAARGSAQPPPVPLVGPDACLKAAAGGGAPAGAPLLAATGQQPAGLLSIQQWQHLQQQHWQKQQRWEQQQQQWTQQQGRALEAASSLPGALGDAFVCLQAGSCYSQQQRGENDSSSDWCQWDHVMHSSSSSPNLQQHNGPPAVQQHVAYGAHNSDRPLPMRSSSSCSSLSGLPGVGGPAAPAGGVIKSRLGRLAAASADQAAVRLMSPDAALAGLRAPGSPAPSSCSALPGQWPEQLLQSCPVAVPSSSCSTSCAADCAAASSNWALERATSSCSMQSEGLGRRLRIHCATFNMGSRVPQCVPLLLLGLHTPELPDLIAIATQESGSVSEWERLLAASLGPAGYEKLAWQSLRAIHLVLFAGQRFKRQVVAVRGSAVATGIGNLVGNKGGVALAVQLQDLKLLFIGSHFAAHGDKVERRNADFCRIKAGLFNGSASSSPSSSMADIAGSSSTINSGANSPLQAGTLQPCGTHGCEAVARAASAEECGGSRSKWGSRSGRVVCVSGSRDCSSQGGRGTTAGGSLSPRSWLLGVAPDACTTGRTGSMGSLSPCCSEGSGYCMEGSCNDSLPAQLGKQLRAASYPSSGATAPAALRAEMSACSSTSSASGRSSLSLPGLAGAGRSWSACEGTATAALGSGNGSLSIAEEVRSQLSFFKSFVVRRPSVGLLSNRNAAGGDVTLHHDVVFWVGDLNYRINGNTRAINYLMRSRLHEVMHANDQLRLQQKKGRVFQGFKEGRIHFPPTFKFLPGTSDYSERRVPSWTDRILWKVSSPEEAPHWGGGGCDGGEAAPAAPVVVQAYYTSVPEVASSDHKPVVAGFEVALAGCELPTLEEAVPSMRQRCCIM